MEKPLDKILEIKDLKVELMSPDGLVTAVRGANLTVTKGEIHGIVGESGCGKSVMMKSVMRLHDEKKTAYTGSIDYEGKDILSMKNKELQKLRGRDIAMIFQNPMTSLSPIMKIGEQISEAVLAKQSMSKAAAKEKALNMLELVGITPAADRYNMYPFELSGGLLQRVMIAMAMVNDPTILIADEPTTALDVTIQAQILSMICDLQRKYGTSVIMITHDLGVVAETCDKVGIMYAGEIVEYGTLEDIFTGKDHHPYTTGLFGSIPNLQENARRLHPIEGLMPDPTNLPKGCKFAPRCSHCTELCKNKQPEVWEKDGHQIRCHLFSSSEMKQQKMNSENAKEAGK